MLDDGRWWRSALTVLVVVASWLSGDLIHAQQPSTAAPLQKLLEHDILPPDLPLEQVQAYTESRVPEMPELTDQDDWQQQAERIRQNVLQNVVFRGKAADWRDAELQIQWQDELEGGDGYRIRKLRFEALPGLWIPALLYEPDQLSGKVPVVMNVNGHDGEGKAADYKQIRCINQAKRGMLALNVEWLGMGQLRGDGYVHYRMNQLDLCGTSGLAPFYLAMKRGLDVLLEHPHADPQRVAVAGLSGGGWQTIFISSLDTRVTLSNPVAGYSGFRTRARHFSDLGDSEQTPSDLATAADYTHLTALLAPRPALLTYNIRDNCCFASDHALPPLLDAAKPVYELYEQADRLHSHVNEDPGTHNFEQDNREALYRMFGRYFFKDDSGFSAREIPCQDEVQTADQLQVALPSDNLDFNELARSLAMSLPRDAELPAERQAAEKWLSARRESLASVVKAKTYEVSAEEAGQQKAEGSEARLWKLHMGDAWTVPAVELTAAEGNSQRTAIVVADGGREAAAERAGKLLDQGYRVVALDPFYFGESKISQRDHLFALLVAAVGERPLGLQASQVAAAARWLDKQRQLGPVTLVADGPRSSLYALIAAALEPNSIKALQLHGTYGSLKEIIEQNVAVDRAPELFCFGLLEHSDILQLAALVAPRQLSVPQPSDRAREQLKPLAGWYALWDAPFELTAELAAVEATDPSAQTVTSRGPLYSVGVAQVDITPGYPVRLSGFGFRRTESEGVTQPIYAKALAISDERGEPAVVITVDNLGVPDELVQQLAERLAKKTGLAPQRLAVTATHTHTAPMLTDTLSTLFSQPIPAEHQQHIDRYTRELLESLERVASEALADQQPSRLSFAIGTVGFAKNRRTAGGPVDHDLPMLAVETPEGKLRAVYVNYACHCVTLSHNKISGDWAGYAQQLIQQQQPGAIALISIGCGADANPDSGVTGDRFDVAAAQGAQIAREVARMLKSPRRPVTGRLTTYYDRIQLPLDSPPTKEEWRERAKRDDAIGYHARVSLDRLERGEKLPTEIEYPIQSWTFGDSLAMVFLPGEVVVDYAVRLKRTFDAQRLWINAYANHSPCYIPSERILREGGYEGGGAMTYYDLPARLRPGLEDRIVGVVEKQLPETFRPDFNPDGVQGVMPKTPQQSLATIQVEDSLQVELVAAEPLVVDPVAIDFGPDGRLWVAEMHDYPAGEHGDFGPGGRVRVLQDTDGDGQYDTSRIFLDGIPYPTGITVWKEGVLVCAAPDILYAEDTDGDGRADVRKTLFTGFATHNYQARVNSLQYGLDNWVYGACGLFGGEIESFAGGPPAQLVNRDFRCNPATGAIEPASGRTQQSRMRSDWGDWFGCTNGRLLLHFPLIDHYLRRNPYVGSPATEVFVPAFEDPSRLYPISRPLERFNSPESLNRVTSGCGTGPYRDVLLGEQFQGNWFGCEPVHNVVVRHVLQPHGVTFKAIRGEGEDEREFLASSDNWFRPVQARTGPDGALYIVDMYRFVIEHPRWISPETLDRLDTRAGETMGRIYRVRARKQPLRPVKSLVNMETTQLVAQLDTENGPQRDLVHQMLLWRGDRTATEPLVQLARSSKRPEARLQALCTLDGLGELPAELVRDALADEHAGVRRHAVRLSESRLQDAPQLQQALLDRLDDPDPHVQMQLAYSLGEWQDEASTEALSRLALRWHGDAFLTAAVLSSVGSENVAPILGSVLKQSPPPQGALRGLLATAAATLDESTWSELLQPLVRAEQGEYEAWQYLAAANLLDDISSKRTAIRDAALNRLAPLLIAARQLVADDQTDAAQRLVAVRLLGRATAERSKDMSVLTGLLAPYYSSQLQGAAIDALLRVGSEQAFRTLVDRWRGMSPQLRGRILDGLMARDASIQILLDAIADGQMQAAHLDASRRQRLLEVRNESLRQRAEQLLSAASTADRQQVVDAYQKALPTPGDPQRGHEVFQKACANCHKLDGRGFEVGPDLNALTNKTHQSVLVSVLDPNRAVDDRYLQYTALTVDGQAITGMLASESATSITLVGPEKKEQVVLRAELEEMQSSGKSLMPEGLEREITPAQMADLLAYVVEGLSSADDNERPTSNVQRRTSN